MGWIRSRPRSCVVYTVLPEGQQLIRIQPVSVSTHRVNVDSYSVVYLMYISSTSVIRPGGYLCASSF